MRFKDFEKLNMYRKKVIHLNGETMFISNIEFFDIRHTENLFKLKTCKKNNKTKDSFKFIRLGNDCYIDFFGTLRGAIINICDNVGSIRFEKHFQSLTIKDNSILSMQKEKITLM